MKKLFLLAGLFGLVSAFTLTNITGKKDFEGIITYDIKYTEVPEILRGYESMLPSISTMYIKGDWARVEVPMAMGGNQVVVINQATNSGFILMDILGSKYAVKMSKEELEKEAEGLKKNEITYVDGETKTILGYKCKKAIVFNPNTGEKNELYYTTKIKNVNQSYESLPGMPLQYTTYANETRSISTASKVEEKKLSEDLFEIPDGYEMKTMEELENFGQ